VSAAPGMELFERVAAHAHARPDSIAAREVGLASAPSATSAASVTYRDLVHQVGGVAHEIQQRVGPGAVVILITGNRVEYFTACLGIWAAGCTAFPMHPSVAKELPAAANRAGARLITTDSRHVREPLENAKPEIIDLRDILSAAGESPLPAHAGATAGLMLQSSGTTGLPKIVHRGAAAIDAVARNVAEATGLTPSDRIFAAAPICHAYGIENGFLAPLWAGSTVHLCDGLDLPVAMREFGATDHSGSTVFPGVPFMFEVLAKTDAPSDTNLRLAYSAGGMLPHAIAQAFEHRFGLRVGQLYGASELGSVTFNHPDYPAADPLSVGRPMHGVSIRILNPDDNASLMPQGQDGLVAIRAPSMMDGYVDDDVPIIDAHFLTGDLGHLDPTGALTITGRLKQLIDVGGMKVNPAEVEAVLSAHPGVRECVVVGVAVTPTVSRLKAVVVPVNGTLDPEDLRRFARERLAGHKVPRLVEVRTSLPRTPSGKVLRSQLEEPE
jgi:acyl-CoA synthetase (AMP-forming)/AMP-acid ligase II